MLRAAAVILTLLLLCTSFASAEAARITRNRVYYERSGSKEARISEFTVNGRPAFCIERGKTGPKTGTMATPTIYKKKDLDKYLYYGYGGPEQWKGFRSTRAARSVTAVLLSNAHSGGGSFKWLDDYSSFVRYIGTKKNPDIGLHLSTCSPSVSYDEELGVQATEYISVSGSDKGSLSLRIPEGVVLRMLGSEETTEGETVLKAGDSFRLEAAEGADLTVPVSVKGISKKLEVTVYVTKSKSVQDLAQMNIVDDLESPVIISFDWISRTSLKLTKTDEDGKSLPGCTFKLVTLGEDGKLPDGSTPSASAMRSPDIEGEIIKVNSDGVFESVSALSVDKCYALCEVSPPEGYVLSDEVKIFDTLDGTAGKTITFINRKQSVKLIIRKKGESYSISGGKVERREINLEGAVFAVTGEDGFSREVTTGRDGRVCIDDIRPGRYTVKEVEAPYGYELSTKEYPVDIGEDASKAELEYNLNVVNKRVPSSLTIVKCDKESRERLEGAVFSVVSSDGKSIEVSTDRNGEAVIRNLPEGEYAVREISPPLGYDTAEKEQSVTISLESAELAEASCTFFDSRTKGASPKTGDRNSLRLYIVLAVLCCIGQVVLTLLRRCDKL